jgi:NAD(P)-dependent dehydrogenase (short-subunit alcohol dehydrogenase family)
MLNNMLVGKTILVTGASSGIGRAVAFFFSTQGARVIISGRATSRLNETLSILSGEGHFYVTGDLSKPDELKVLMDDVFDRAGTIDSIVHCAGIQKTLPLQALKEGDFDDIFSTNVKSAQFIAKYLRRKGRYNNNGTSLIFITSVAAFCGEPAISTYSASKAALIGLSKSLAAELSRNNIRVNCIAPGQVETEMALKFSKQLTIEQQDSIKSKHLLGLGKPEDIAHAAAFLASDLSRWITGTTLFVDGGYSAQ